MAQTKDDGSQENGSVHLERSPPKTSYRIQSLVLGLRVLEALIKSDRGIGVTELASALGTTKWRVFRQLSTLCEEGYVAQDAESSKYQIGPRVYALVEALPARFGFVRMAREEMQLLRRKRGHTVVVAGPVNDHGVMVLDAEMGTQPVQYVLKIGAIFDLHSSAHGKTALAFGSPVILEHTLRRKLKPHTAATITDPERLRAEIETIRTQGWATAPEEAYPGVNTVVAPIFSAGGKLEGSIGVFGSIDTIPAVPHPEDIAAVVESAGRISKRLGWK
jgi:IclR family KDG regulon transcriptional repressor